MLFGTICVLKEYTDVTNTISTRVAFYQKGNTDQILGSIMPFASYARLTAK
jgi:hypothetical protein